MGVDDVDCMHRCAQAAAQADAAGGFPNGSCVVSVDGEILGLSGSRAEDTPDPTAHAEVSAIRAAASVHGAGALVGATLFTTLEPCAMCLHAAAAAGVVRIVLGCRRSAVGDSAYVSTISADELAAQLIRPIELTYLPVQGIAERVRAFLS